jgi:hypothetical protein
MPNQAASRSILDRHTPGATVSVRTTSTCWAAREVTILSYSLDQPRCYGELRRLSPKSPKRCSFRSDLEADGIAARTAPNRAAPRVDHRPTAQASACGPAELLTGTVSGPQSVARLMVRDE